MGFQGYSRTRTFLFVSIFALLGHMTSSATPANHYRVIKLVANNVSFGAPFVDPRLINPWGLVFSNHGNLIVADNGGPDLATSYKPQGRVQAFTISGSFDPTGLEKNDSRRDFLIGPSNNRRAARLLFATELGTIMAYNKEVSTSDAQVVIDRSANGSVYKGIALATMGPGNRQYIYATDFHNGNVDVFDFQFNFVKSFTDATIPAGFAPFNIRNFNNRLYVTYAKQLPPANHDDMPGPGNGFVDIFDPSGTLIQRLISNGPLNSPWGLAIAPDCFGRFSDALLVGNFGDGVINAFNRHNGSFLGSLSDTSDNTIVIDGLWSLKFWGKRSNRLYFTSGPNGETNGLIGAIVPKR